MISASFCERYCLSIYLSVPNILFGMKYSHSKVIAILRFTRAHLVDALFRRNLSVSREQSGKRIQIGTYYIP